MPKVKSGFADIGSDSIFPLFIIITDIEMVSYFCFLVTTAFVDTKIKIVLSKQKPCIRWSRGFCYCEGRSTDRFTLAY